MPSDALVVGGGIGGLVAARRLALEGLSVTLFERSDRLGGQVARQRVGGVDLDAAAESFATRGGTVAALLQELGLADDIVTPRPSPAWLQPDRRHRRAASGHRRHGHPGRPARCRRDPRDRPSRCVARPARHASSGEQGSGCRVPRRARPRADGPAPWPTASSPRWCGESTRRDRRAPGRAGPSSAADGLRERGSLAAAVRALRAAGARRSPGRRHPGRHVPARRRAGSRLRAPRRRDRARRRRGGRRPARRHRRRPATRAGSSSRRTASAADTAGRQVTLVTLVVEAPGSGRRSARHRRARRRRRSGVRARALTHLTAKWSWVADAAAGAPRPAPVVRRRAGRRDRDSRRRMPASSSARRSSV